MSNVKRQILKIEWGEYCFVFIFTEIRTYIWRRFTSLNFQVHFFRIDFFLNKKSRYEELVKYVPYRTLFQRSDHENMTLNLTVLTSSVCSL